MTPQLLKPCAEYADSWWEALKEFENENVSGFWNLPEKPKDIDSYIKRVEAQSSGKSFEKARVPSTTFWLIDNDKFVGHVNIRHYLNERLENIGGHIGYAVSPNERQKGYGTKILELALVEARKLGIEKALLTCDEDNIGSRKIIEINGGKYIKNGDFEGRNLRYYIVDTSTLD